LIWGARFDSFVGSDGLKFLSFSGLETGLKIECFSRSPWGSWMAPQNKSTGGSEVKMVVWIQCNNLSTTSWVITLAKDEDLGLTAEPRSLVAPPKGGPADPIFYFLC